jgi:uncharacterized protein
VTTENLAPQRGELPHANPSELTAPFWNGCAAGELRFQRCLDCGAANFPPAEHCRACTSFRLEWQVSSGRATLYSWTIVHRPVTPAFAPPYAPAIVTLEEGYQMLTNIVGIPAETLRTDLELQVEFHRVDGGGDSDCEQFWLPYFTGVPS